MSKERACFIKTQKAKNLRDETGPTLPVFQSHFSTRFTGADTDVLKHLAYSWPIPLPQSCWLQRPLYATVPRPSLLESTITLILKPKILFLPWNPLVRSQAMWLKACIEITYPHSLILNYIINEHNLHSDIQVAERTRIDFRVDKACGTCIFKKSECLVRGRAESSRFYLCHGGLSQL